MGIHPPDTPPIQAMILDELQNFIVLGYGGCRQISKEREDLMSIGQGPARQLPDDKRVRHDLLFFQEARERFVPPPQVGDPYGGINQDHAVVPVLRRRIGRSRGAEPPSFARRRALSRAISVSRPM